MYDHDDLFVTVVNAVSQINKEDKHLKWLLTNDDMARETGTFTCKVIMGAVWM